MGRINYPNSVIMNINLDEIIPKRHKVFESQGIHPESKSSERIQHLYDESLALFTNLAQPVAIIADITLDEFTAIYSGEGRNEISNVLINIYPRAKYLCLFALTMGHEVSAKIELLFKENDYPMGYMLDSIASIAADNTSELLEKKNLEKLQAANLINEDTRVLSYSPGYCGWHISGQKKLFAYLKPEKIGISLNSSYLMTPLKSVSGVLVAGDSKIHLFKPNYPFCKICKTHSCLQRMKENRHITTMKETRKSLT